MQYSSISKICLDIFATTKMWRHFLNSKHFELWPPIFGDGKNDVRFLKPLTMQKKWLCQVWGLGEHNCKWNNSSNSSLEPFYLNSNSNQMDSKPFGNLNHHMELQNLAPCQVTRSSDKVQFHDDFTNCSWAVTVIYLVLLFYICVLE